MTTDCKLVNTKEKQSDPRIHPNQLKKGQQKAGPYGGILRRITKLKMYINSTFGSGSQALSWKGVARRRRPGPVAPCRTPATGYTLVQKLRHHVPKS